jgi:hypothetical protein
LKKYIRITKVGWKRVTGTIATPIVTRKHVF